MGIMKGEKNDYMGYEHRGDEDLNLPSEEWVKRLNDTFMTWFRDAAEEEITII